MIPPTFKETFISVPSIFLSLDKGAITSGSLAALGLSPTIA